MQTIDFNVSPGSAPGFSSDLLESERIRKGLKWSLGLHLGFFVVVLFKNFIWPFEPNAYVPVLRVDVVGLPDLLKNEIKDIPPNVAQPEEAPAPKAETVEKSATPDEMVLDTSKKKPKPKEKEEKDLKKRDHSLKNAISRIRALEKIVNDEPKEVGVVIRGAKVSPGTSTSEDAREADEASYLDVVRDSVRAHWFLPAIIERQKLSSRVLIYINPRGQVVGMKIIKPSGDAKFDEAVRRAIQEANPLPAPPKDFASEAARSGVNLGFPL